jgi:DNA invertase Pin-like site-specific DNA recombinase
MKKRVWSLCRVSTEKQSESIDDVPMQRNAIAKCIVEHEDWILDKEFVEVDVSGYKLKSSERDKLTEIMEGAKNKQFEIFLVFMFDRIGRRWDDSPQVVEGIVMSGVEVWSVKEGQQKFDNHVDRLINFITFWQAGGESLKTSIRVKEQMEQLNEQGRYMGGTPPYGYETYDSGIFKKDKNGKKLKELKYLRINKDEASVVQLIYKLSIEKGYGSNRIAKYLNVNFFLTRLGEKWRSNYVMRVLTNPIYKGYKRYYENKVDLKLQPFNSNYVIIPEEIWDKAQAVCNKRKTSLKTDKTLFPRKSELLFSGLVSCGYCGKKLLTDYTVKYYKRKDGVTTKSVVMRYYCGHRKNFHTEFEHEVTQFGAKKYESESLIHINEQLSKINFSTFDNIVKKNIELVIENKKTEIKNRKRQLLDKENELNALESLRIKVELGQSKLSESHVENMMIKCQKEIENIKQLVQTLKDDIESDINNLKNSSELKDLLSGWNTIFPNADFDTQKMMLSKALKNISFKKDEIDLDIKLI